MFRYKYPLVFEHISQRLIFNYFAKFNLLFAGDWECKTFFFALPLTNEDWCSSSVFTKYLKCSLSLGNAAVRTSELRAFQENSCWARSGILSVLKNDVCK